MPKALEEKLMKEAEKKHMGKKQMGAYVYGTMRKTGWTPQHTGQMQDHDPSSCPECKKMRGKKYG